MLPALVRGGGVVPAAGAHAMAPGPSVEPEVDTRSAVQDFQPVPLALSEEDDGGGPDDANAEEDDQYDSDGDYRPSGTARPETAEGDAAPQRRSARLRAQEPILFMKEDDYQDSSFETILLPP